MAKIICIETSTAVCSVAVCENEQLLGLKESAEPNMHSQLIHQYMHELMQELNLSFSDINAVAVCRGPGSYTGLRIGVSAAKGISYGLQIPLMSVSTLEALAWKSKQEYGYGENNIFCPTIDARRMEIYTALYDYQINTILDVHAKKMDESSFMDIIETKTLILSGDGAEKCRPIYSEQDNVIIASHILPSAEWMIEIANQQFEDGFFEDLAYFEPFYLKDFIPGISSVKGLKM